MEEFALSTLSWHQDQLWGLQYGPLIAGLIAAALLASLLDARFRLNRVNFLICVAFTMLFSGVMNMVSTPIQSAIENGNYWVLFAAGMVTGFLTGFLVMWAAMARSRDAFGRSFWGILAFIPLIWFVLLFKRTENDNAPDQLRFPPILSGAAGCVLAVVILFVGLGLSNLAERIVKQDMQSGISLLVMQKIGDAKRGDRAGTGDGKRPGVDTSSPLVISRRDLAAKLKRHFGKMKVPVKIDQHTMLESVTVLDTMVMFDYRIPDEITIDPSVLEPIIQERYCSQNETKFLIMSGASYIARYHANGRPGHMQVAADLKSCQSIWLAAEK